MRRCKSSLEVGIFQRSAGKSQCCSMGVEGLNGRSSHLDRYLGDDAQFSIAQSLAAWNRFKRHVSWTTRKRSSRWPLTFLP